MSKKLFKQLNFKAFSLTESLIAISLFTGIVMPLVWFFIRSPEPLKFEHDAKTMREVYGILHSRTSDSLNLIYGQSSLINNTKRIKIDSTLSTYQLIIKDSLSDLKKTYIR